MEQMFLDIGLEAKFVASTMKNKVVCQKLEDVIKMSGVNKCDKKMGSLLYNVATTLPSAISIGSHKELLVTSIASNKIMNVHRYTLAIDFLKINKEREDMKQLTEEFNKAIGLGIEVTDEDVQKNINDILETNKEEVDRDRYTINLTKYLKLVRETLPFAEAGVINKTFQACLLARLGPQGEADKKMKEGLKKKQSEKDKQKVTGQLDKLRSSVQAQQEGRSETFDDQSINMYDINNYVARDLGTAVNSQALEEAHKAATGGLVQTRFPPEPNGYIHIGHAKAMRFSFMVAKQNAGNCYLRFDDTNPDKESQEYIQNIIENTKWLGYTPYKITHSSDNFGYLHSMAVKLIKKGKAYICDQNKEQMSEGRQKMLASPNREKGIEQNLKEFEMMRLGMYEEGEVMLRLKIDFASKNPTMRDPVIYRIKYTTHPHVGNKWCIYPCYDFTHGLCDSIENITHSLCTLEFEVRRDLYYWILQECEVYRPQVWEYSRMNLSNTVVSKRKLQELVIGQHVDGWDDPRLSTIMGLRRKGYTATAINRFCDLMGVTRRGNENFVNINILEQTLRQELDITSDRSMGVLEPIKMYLTNLPKDRSFTAPLQPKNLERGSYKVTLSDYVYVDRRDIKSSEKEVFGILEGRYVGLKYAGQVLIKSVETEGEQVKCVRAEYVGQRAEKAKGFMHWIAPEESLDVEIRLFENLITAYNPNEAKQISDVINPSSRQVLTGCKVNKTHITGLKGTKSIQLERLGYFCHDKESRGDKIVLNRSAALGDLKEK